MDISSETQLSSANPAMLAHMLKSQGYSQHQILSSTNINPTVLDDKAVEHAEAFLEKKASELNNFHNAILFPIKKVIVENIGNAFTLDEAAKEFHISSRTLNRRLKNIGTSFQKIANEVRRNKAIKHLQEGVLSVKDIAYGLGYQDTSNFSKAFKSWTGLTPSNYRKEHY